ncbi:hypothetical protein [Fictibacillus sp. S7]|uniref:hypothetical protein n=1 Tax=Fictibacillus sp. S7 TaxID=2212476 RepID=UPI0010138FC5|nr:hypothetical protein [Fictibacillus sp. S7]RXY98912.1 hypothetical protein DMO16_04045 [Fictibacillus sp. S7]
MLLTKAWELRSRYSYVDVLGEKEEAEQMLRDYFDNLNKRDFMLAYEKWDNNWKHRHSYDNFEAGYADVQNYLDYYVTSTLSSDNGVTLEGSITAEEGYPEQIYFYQFTYETKEIDGTWKIVSGKLKKLY